ncbi:hypothetical protein AMTR_s00111p00049270 [Amborella trichopoda]|uniref:Uncharacterized protein n=1 Tax=Amborella trichopoda TaxID=13333 RepID=W1NXW1_AMBTC|nr:hypothetical protein AMTR_s00111p00049270 [Amborella trichopoda]
MLETSSAVSTFSPSAKAARKSPGLTEEHAGDPTGAAGRRPSHNSFCSALGAETDAAGGGVKTVRTSTLARLAGGGDGDVPTMDKPFLLTRVPLFTAVKTNLGCCVSFLFLPPCFSSLSLGGSLLGPVTVGAL